jgi:hypothetical protein
MNAPASPAIAASESAQSQQAYYQIYGATLVLVGALHCLLSFLMLSSSIFFPGGWTATLEQWSASGLPGQAGFVEVSAFYVVLMNWTGWVAGAFSIHAGLKVRREGSARLARRAAILNLFYFPLGLTVGILGLVSLRPPHHEGEATGG